MFCRIETVPAEHNSSRNLRVASFRFPKPASILAGRAQHLSMDFVLLPSGVSSSEIRPDSFAAGLSTAVQSDPKLCFISFRRRRRPAQMVIVGILVLRTSTLLNYDSFLSSRGNEACCDELCVDNKSAAVLVVL